MSTRCQVRVVKNGYPLNFYHHYDGYLSGVGAELRKWLKGDDDRPVEEAVDEVVQKMCAEGSGYEPTFWRHVDIEFFYLLDFDSKVFKGYELKGWDPWADEGKDGYNASKPWYDQMPCNVGEETDLLADDFGERAE